MSGQAGIRGYMVQTLVSLLESLDDPRWTAIRVEPGGENEQADLLVWKDTSASRALQIKHSQNLVTAAKINKWAGELEASVDASELVLLVVGHANAGALSLQNIGRVRIAAPLNLNIAAILEQASNRLDKFLERGGISKVPAFARDIVVRALVTRLEEYSTAGTYVPRAEFDELLRSWITILYPSAVNEAAEILHLEYETKLERVRNDLRHTDRIAEARYRLKHDACLDALNIVDEAFASAAKVQAGEPKSPFELGERARACHNKLVVSCDSPEVLKWFKRAIGVDGLPRGDVVVDLRAAVRVELGFGNSVIDEDRNSAWFGTIGVKDLSSGPEQDARIAAMRAEWPNRAR